MKEFKIDSILINVEARKDSMMAAEEAISIAKNYNSTIIALNVVNLESIKKMHTITGNCKSELEIEVEENGWHYLYYIAELAKGEGVSINIAQEEGIEEEVLAKYADKYDVNLIIIGYPKEKYDQKRLRDHLIENLLQRTHSSLLVVQANGKNNHNHK